MVCIEGGILGWFRRSPLRQVRMKDPVDDHRVLAEVWRHSSRRSRSRSSAVNAARDVRLGCSLSGVLQPPETSIGSARDSDDLLSSERARRPAALRLTQIRFSRQNGTDGILFSP
jgi:hypothetical protein